VSLGPVSPSEARRLLIAHFSAHPPAVSGELYIAPEWREDVDDYLPVWGSREFLVDGDASYGRWDNTVIFIDKRTREVRRDLYTSNLDKISAMSSVIVPE
jgi:hypothetical protein